METVEATPEVEHEEISDVDFFAKEAEKEKVIKVSRDIARADFLRVLSTWKVLRKAHKKMKSKDADIKSGVIDALDKVLDAIQEGTLIVEKKGPFGVLLVHELIEPVCSASGEVMYSTLEYKRVPKIVDLRKMDQFEEKQQIAKLQALAAAMTGKDVSELANLSSSDIDMLGALLIFFV